MEELIRELLEEVKSLRRDIQAAFPKPYENMQGLTARIRGGEFVTTPEPKRLTPDWSGIQAHEAMHEDISADVVPGPDAPGVTILGARREFSFSGRPENWG